MLHRLVVIGRWDDPSSRQLVLQDFIVDGASVIPVFSSESAFRRRMAGTPYESQGIAIERAFLISILRGDEQLLLDPGEPHARRLTKAMLAAEPEMPPAG